MESGGNQSTRDFRGWDAHSSSTDQGNSAVRLRLPSVARESQRPIAVSLEGRTLTQKRDAFFAFYAHSAIP